MKWWGKGQTPLPPDTVILKNEGSFNLDVFPLDYPVLWSPATWVLHPIWRLGKLEDDDGEHFYYRFDGNEIHTGERRKCDAKTNLDDLPTLPVDSSRIIIHLIEQC